MDSVEFRKSLARNPVFCALDTPDRDRAVSLAKAVGPSVGGFKLGLEFYAAQGPAGVAALKDLGRPLFVDLKLHDIPNTVAGGLRSLNRLGVDLVTVHASGGLEMMRAAADAAAEAGPHRPRILAVTVLTSLDGTDLARIGVGGTPAAQVQRLARLAREATVDGLVCSAAEIALVREVCGPDMLIVVPGLRPAGSATGDQKRLATPEGAHKAGADVLVIGRPITDAPDPAAAARAIAASLGAPR